ncbi:MAG: hypothetical protein Q9183_006631 [Haloplaca sp. 2 TL-2023]
MNKDTAVLAAKHYRKIILALTMGGKEVKAGRAAAEYRLCLVNIQAKLYGRAIKAGDRACALIPQNAEYKKAREMALKEHLDNHTRHQRKVRKFAAEYPGMIVTDTNTDPRYSKCKGRLVGGGARSAT